MNINDAPEYVRPADIEKRSMAIIAEELGDRVFDPLQEPVIKRVIHTTADFDYADNLCFSDGAVREGLEALRHGAVIVTDTQMAKAGINKRTAKLYDVSIECFMSDPDVAEAAKQNGTTRAQASMEKAATLYGSQRERPLIIAAGNAPTALIALKSLIDEQKIRPALVIGVPVGFVNVVYAKELIMTAGIPFIVARGRKGGSNVAAAICNALLYQLAGKGRCR